MIKVGFDISQLAHQGGVVTYTNNLTDRLVKDKDLEMVFFYSSLRKPYLGKLPNVKRYPIPPSVFEPMFNQIRWPKIEQVIGEVEVFHSSDWVQPPTDAKKVTTYHDMVPLIHPEWSIPEIVNVNKRRLGLVEKEIDVVIAVSQATKNDLVKVSSIPEEKIVVIYEGVDERFKLQSQEAVDKFRDRYHLPSKFVLAIGGVGKRRNLDRVKQASRDYDLVISRQTIPDISDNELPLLYASAKLLLYPSLYEGFGLPILEAMACGTPVITSNISSMPEVGGDAAIYVDPTDVEAISRAIAGLWEDKGKREEMINKGFSQSSKFSWDKCAEQTADLYRRIVK